MKKRILEQAYRRKTLNRQSKWYHDDLIGGHSCGETTSKDGKKYIEKYDMPNKKYYRKYGARKVRRYKGDISNGSSYKRFYDLWWDVY